VRNKAQDTGVRRGEGRQRSRAVGSHSKISSVVRSDRSSMRFTIGKSQGEISKGGLTHRGFTYRESFEPMHCSIEKLKTPTSGKTVVMGITVIWARRASA
jgi:hypothetical protein